MALSSSAMELKSLSGALFAEFISEDVSWFLHELIAVAATFEDARFEAAGSVRDFAGGDLGKQAAAVIGDGGRGDQVTRQLHPRTEYIPARAGEANLSRLFVVQGNKGVRTEWHCRKADKNLRHRRFLGSIRNTSALAKTPMNSNIAVSA